MIFPKLKGLAKENNWYRSKSNVFGLYKDYFFNLSDGQGYKTIYARLNNISEETIKQIDDELMSKKKDIGFTEKVVSSDGVFLKLSESFLPLKKTALYTSMDFLVDLFVRFRLPNSNCCAECKGKERLNYYHISDVGTILCDSCISKLTNESERNADAYHSEEKYYLRGAIGAILFSMAGVIAWVLLGYYAERIFAILAFAFAYLSLKGYDMFKAKRGKWTPAIIISINIGSIIISNIATMIFALMMNGLTWQDSWNALLTNEKVISAVKKDTFMSFIVCALALYYLGRSLWVSHTPSNIARAILVE